LLFRRAPLDSVTRDFLQPFRFRSVEHRKPEFRGDTGMTPVGDSVPGTTEALCHLYGAAKRGDDLGRIHMPIVSSFLILCKLVRSQIDSSSDTLIALQSAILMGMETPLQQAVATRLRALMSELKMNRREMAEYLQVAENRLGNWLGKGSKASMPAEESMILLCSKIRGLTLDYIYRGHLEHLPTGLAIRLTAWEQGIDPDREHLEAETLVRAAAAALRSA